MGRQSASRIAACARTASLAAGCHDPPPAGRGPLSVPPAGTCLTVPVSAALRLETPSSPEHYQEGQPAPTRRCCGMPPAAIGHSAPSIESAWTRPTCGPSAAGCGVGRRPQRHSGKGSALAPRGGNGRRAGSRAPCGPGSARAIRSAFNGCGLEHIHGRAIRSPWQITRVRTAETVISTNTADQSDHAYDA